VEQRLEHPRSVYCSGNAIKTERIGFDSFHQKEIESAVGDFRTLSVEELRKKYGLDEDSRDWSVDRAKKDTLDNPATNFLRQFYIAHLTFGTLGSAEGKGFIGTPARLYATASKTRHLSLWLSSASVSRISTHLCSTQIVSAVRFQIEQKKLLRRFLYIFIQMLTRNHKENLSRRNGRRPNFSAEFVKYFAETIGLKFIADGRGDLKKLSPQNIFYYAYAIFHSPSYRERYAEFCMRISALTSDK